MEMATDEEGGLVDGARGTTCAGGIFHHHTHGGGGDHHHDHCVIARRETEQAEHLSAKVRWAVHASLCANVLLSIASAYAAIRSGSLAVLASLVDTLLDLISQVVLSVAEHCMRKPSDEHYPAGRSRIEPVGVIIVSVIMGVAALELLRASVGTMVMALAYHKLPVLDMEPVTIVIMCVAVGTKVALYLYSSTLAPISGTAEALAEDHKNDIMTNSFSVISSTVAHYFPKAWFVDPVGAILISCLIFYNWLHVGMDHASKIVGLSAPPETLEHITELAAQHHAQLELDIIRAYHFGPNFLVELEVVLPWDMSVKEAHDIALSLQQKVEQQSFVERCFVHVDYTTRTYNEHKI